MDTTWLTKQQAADMIGVSTKTIEKLAADKVIQQAYGKSAAGAKISVYHPGDVERVRKERSPDAAPFVLPPAKPSEKSESVTAVATSTPQALDGLTLSPNAAEDEIPPVPEAPVTRTGDLWLMGEHRLLCGDATKAEDVTLLMAGERAGLMNTDPPYGIAYDSADLHEHGVSYAAIDGDQRENQALQDFLECAFRLATDALQPNAAWYMWHAMLTQGFFAAAAAAAHVILHRQIIWAKPVLVFGRGQYHWKHELCFMGWVQGHQPPDYSDHTDVTVWEVHGVELKDRKDFKHSTPKPVELFRRPIIKHLQRGEIAYEPFAGTGPQFIAAQLTERRCFGLELVPAYCDVIVTRWQNLTGKQATLDGSHGVTFEQVKLGRRMGERDAIVEEAFT